jgi:hypothetical protein
MTRCVRRHAPRLLMRQSTLYSRHATPHACYIFPITIPYRIRLYHMSYHMNIPNLISNHITRSVMPCQTIRCAISHRITHCTASRIAPSHTPDHTILPRTASQQTRFASHRIAARRAVSYITWRVVYLHLVWDCRSLACRVVYHIISYSNHTASRHIMCHVI